MSSATSVEETLKNLSNAIEDSKYKDLISEGLFFFSQCLEGKPVETDRLIEPIQKSIKILGEDIEKQMVEASTTSDNNEEMLCVNRLIGKSLKRKIFLLSGEDIEEEEKEQIKEDSKHLLEYLLKNLELL